MSHPPDPDPDPDPDPEEDEPWRLERKGERVRTQEASDKQGLRDPDGSRKREKREKRDGVTLGAVRLWEALTEQGVVTVLQPDEGVRIQVADVRTANVVGVLLHQHPPDVCVPETVHDAVRVPGRVLPMGGGREREREREREEERGRERKRGEERGREREFKR